VGPRLQIMGSRGRPARPALPCPEAKGLYVILHGLAMIRGDDDILHLTGPIFDGIYEYCRDAMLLGREPS